VVLETRDEPLVKTADERLFFRVVKAGFSAKRKKLRSSISAGLALNKQATDELLQAANVNPDDRAEDLSIDDWLRVMNHYKGMIG